MGKRLLEVDYSRSEDAVVVRLHPRQFQVLPEATMGHLRTANKEFLLAMRSIIDGAIQRMESKPEGGPKRKRIQVTKGEG